MVCIFDDSIIFHIRILVRCTAHTREAEERMRRHAASDVVGMSLCGRDCTYDEYDAMKKREAKHVACKHCLRLLK